MVELLSLSLRVFTEKLVGVPKFRNFTYEPRHEKTNVLVSDLVRHKPGCTVTEDG